MGASKIIIIPDLHGREFWRGAVNDLGEDTHVVFLGDYMDPYEDDWLYWCDAFQSLQDIIAFKKARPNQVTLLFGNHDLHYLYPQLKGSRFNEYQEARMRNTFTDNLDAFQMATEFNIGEKRYLFSHAGIHHDWARKHSTLFGPLEKVTAETFNQLMFTPEFVDALAEVSWRRGGNSPVGSMIWTDIYENELSAPIAQDVIQIYGHTRLPEGKQKELNGVICLDCQRVFTLTKEGIV